VLVTHLQNHHINTKLHRGQPHLLHLLKQLGTEKTAADKRASASTISAGAARSSPAPPTGSASTRAPRGSASTRTFNAPRASTAESGILAGKRKRKPPSKFALYFSASGNH